MNRIQYSIYKQDTGNAGGKAKSDAFDIAMSMGFHGSYIPSNMRGVRVVQQILSMPKFAGKKIVFFQYPAVKSSLIDIFSFFAKSSYKIALIHDIPSLQGVSYDKSIEIKQLNYFDCLITHNFRMTKYLRKIGYKGICISLEIFDYLHDVDRPLSDAAFSNTICFAGNLCKSSFCTKLNRIKNCSFNLYGVENINIPQKSDHICYKGLLPSDEIVYLMKGDYGLIWDGDNLETCDGKFGNYLKYNNPHKLSLYIASGKPVITWSNSAIADFVIKNKIGITVNSLLDLNKIDLYKNYYIYKKNVLDLKQKVGTGYFLKVALTSAIEMIDND